MPMEKKEDFALGDPNQNYCQYCTDQKGSLLPYDKILAMNAKYYMDSQGITADAANKMAANLLKSQPAWK
jgi:hypothetical protein